jgi:hypothetical protein
VGRCACAEPHIFKQEHAVHPSRFEDAYDAFVMMGNNPAIIGWTLMSIFSIAFFNFFGTGGQERGATHCVRADVLGRGGGG